MPQIDSTGPLAARPSTQTLVAAGLLAASVSGCTEDIEEPSPTRRLAAQADGSEPGAQARYLAYTPEQLSAAFAPKGTGLADAEAAARFLAQASFGPTVASLAAVRTMGFSQWLEAQFSAPRTEPHTDRVLAQNLALGSWTYTIPVFGPSNSELMLNEAWRVMMTGPDQLRQRIIAALLEIFVITTKVGTIGIGPHQVTAAGYVDMLGEHAFGNFRALLEGVATSAAMGVFLSHRDNAKAEYDATGQEVRVPDENFARELMQLFSIGLYQLQADGSLKLRDGQAEETYSQSDVFNLARVFTGWVVATPIAGQHPLAHWARPMQIRPERHSPEVKQFLGTTIPAGTPAQASLTQALDAIFLHPNVAPFIGRQLIQRLVTSNPSSAYIGRVSAAFNNNGLGVRGDMKALIRAIFMDPEARTPPTVGSSSTFGKPREPMLRLVAVARAMEVGDPGTVVFPVANLSNASTGIGQSPLRAPSVFNFFRPGYVPPQSDLARLGLVGPEFQLLVGPVIGASVNKINEFVRTGGNFLLTDLRHLTDLAAQPSKLLQRVSLLLTGATLSAADASTYLSVVQQVPSKRRELRVQVALQLVASSSACLIQSA
jgi:uncharacterized protein (DUF1800 family)